MTVKCFMTVTLQPPIQTAIISRKIAARTTTSRPLLNPDTRLNPCGIAMDQTPYPTTSGLAQTTSAGLTFESQARKAAVTLPLSEYLL